MTGEKFDWRRYLEFARELAQDPREQSSRSAISRAYYAAFHYARAYVEQSTSTSTLRDGAAHRVVPEQLQRMRPAQSMAANRLIELKKLRTWADYRAGSKSNLEDEVRKALSHAEQIIARLSR